MPKQQRRVTLKDLAEKTGLSATAISHVLNDRLGHVRVSEDTRQRVHAAAAELGYVPKLLARSMVTQRSYFIGVVCSLNDGPMSAETAAYFANALHGVQQVCKQVGYHCLYASCGLGDAQQFTAPRLMKDGSVDGIIVVGHASTDVMRRIVAMDLPCVQVGTNVDPDLHVDVVYPDLDQGIEDAARKLVGLGHRRVELFLPTGPGPRLHMKRFLALAKRINGLKPLAGFAPADWAVPAQGLERADHWAAKKDRPTAFICSPVHAVGLVEGFKAAGLRLADDYSLLALRPQEAGEMRLGSPPRVIDSITFPIHEIGRRAAELMFRKLDLPGDGAVLTPGVACSVTEGQSVAAAPTSV